MSCNSVGGDHSVMLFGHGPAGCWHPAPHTSVASDLEHSPVGTDHPVMLVDHGPAGCWHPAPHTPVVSDSGHNSVGTDHPVMLLGHGPAGCWHPAYGKPDTDNTIDSTNEPSVVLFHHVSHPVETMVNGVETSNDSDSIAL